MSDSNADLTAHDMIRAAQLDRYGECDRRARWLTGPLCACTTAAEHAAGLLSDPDHGYWQSDRGLPLHEYATGCTRTDPHRHADGHHHPGRD